MTNLQVIANTIKENSNQPEPLFALIFSKKNIASFLEGPNWQKVGNLEKIAKIVMENVNDPQPLLAEIFLKQIELAKQNENPDKVLEEVFSNPMVFESYGFDKSRISAIIGDKVVSSTFENTTDL